LLRDLVRLIALVRDLLHLVLQSQL
jgi:hypothetical protein